MTIVIIEDVMNKVFRNFIAISVAAAGALFLIALVSGEGNAALPEKDRCVSVTEAADSLAARAGAMPARADYDHYGYNQAMNLYRFRVQSAMNVIVSNPRCFSVTDVADAATVLSKLTTQ